MSLCRQLATGKNQNGSSVRDTIQTIKMFNFVNSVRRQLHQNGRLTVLTFKLTELINAPKTSLFDA